MKPLFKLEKSFYEKKLNIKLPDECWIENSSIYLNLDKDTLLIRFRIINKKIIISKDKMKETLSKHNKVSWQEEVAKNRDRLLYLEANSIKKTVDFIKKINKEEKRCTGIKSSKKNVCGQLSIFDILDCNEDNNIVLDKEQLLISTSGGKDSTVAGIIAEKAFDLLNIDKFKYLYFNTSNDSADTYKYIKKLQKNRDVWMVNPEVGYYQWITKKKDYFIPSVLVRNCCSTYKEGNLNKILNPNKRYIMILGLRKHESRNRAHYDYNINQSVLDAGKTLNVKPNWYRFAPIVEWTDEDVWLYILMNNLNINPMYKKGFDRVGCLICPQEKAIVDLLVKEYYPKQWKRWEDILTISYNKKGVEKRLKWTLDEWLQGKWKTQTSKEYEILKSKPTPNKIKELAQLKGISEELAKKFFVKECVCCGSKVNPTDIAMSFKILGRKSENIHCGKCLKEKLHINKKEYSAMSVRFREEGCELF